MGHLSLWSSKNLTRLLVIHCYFPGTGWMWCSSHLFVISPKNQMISSKPPDSPVLRPERPKLFPFLSPGSCLRATGNSNATFPLPTFSRSSTTSQRKPCLSISSSVSHIFLAASVKWKQPLAFRVLSHTSDPSMSPQIQRMYIKLPHGAQTLKVKNILPFFFFS